jgi:hypothetical protein
VSRALRRSALPLALLALVLGAPGCLGDDEEGSDVTIPSISVPETTEPPVTTLTTPTTAPDGKPVDPNQPDNPENDVPPPSGSPQENFEEFCKQNPEACS